MGYNFLPSELSAAFALQQLKKLKKNIRIREKNFKTLKEYFRKNHFKYIDLPEQNKNIKTGWLAYPVIIKKNRKFKRKKLQIFLEKNNIQTRTIFTGNILRQPLMNNRVYKKHKDSEVNSNNIMENGLLIGCHHGLSSKDISFIKKKFDLFFEKYVY